MGRRSHSGIPCRGILEEVWIGNGGSGSIVPSMPNATEISTVSEGEAQEELLDFAREVDALAGGLGDLIARLPVSPLEGLMLLGEKDPDVATEIRRVVECLLADHLRPTARALRHLTNDSGR